MAARMTSVKPDTPKRRTYSVSLALATACVDLYSTGFDRASVG